MITTRFLTFDQVAEDCSTISKAQDHALRGAGQGIETGTLAWVSVDDVECMVEANAVRVHDASALAVSRTGTRAL